MKRAPGGGGAGAGLSSALAAAKDRFLSRAFCIHTAKQQRRARQQAARRDGAALTRAMGPFAMINLGVGAIVGSGIFVLTGLVARETAGPAVVLSYACAAVAALLSALAYAEMAVRFPSAGGAFAFASGTFGELVAWTVGADLTLEYALSAAAVGRGLTSYAAALFGKDAASCGLRFPTSVGAVVIDPVAMAAVLAACALLAFGVREASWANTAVNVVNVSIILFVVCLGLSLFSPANLVPFAPFGAKGVVAGAGLVFFSFVGADSVANAAEECKKPSRDLPAGIIGGISVATVLYGLMSLALVGMVPLSQIDGDAPFSAAFASRGLNWAGGVVAAGALTGIATSIFVSLYSQTRLLLILGRAGLLPPAFGRVSARTRTPVAATCATAAGAGLLALLFDLDLLAELVSLGTLAVYTLVCCAVLVRRYRGLSGEDGACGGAGGGGGGAAFSAAGPAPGGGGGQARGGGCLRRATRTAAATAAPRASAAAVGLRLAMLFGLALAGAACFHRSAPPAAAGALAGLWGCVALSFYLLAPVEDDEEVEDPEEEEEEEGQARQEEDKDKEARALVVGRGGEEEEGSDKAAASRRRRRGRAFRMPLQPLLPCLGIAANSFLLGSLGWQAYVRWIVWMVLTVLFYLSYGMWRTGRGGGEEGEEEEGGKGTAAGERGAARGDGGGGGSSGGGGAVELGGLAAADDRRRCVDPLLAGDDGARQPSSSGGGAGGGGGPTAGPAGGGRGAPELVVDGAAPR